MLRKLFICIGIALLVAYAYLYFRPATLSTKKDEHENAEKFHQDRERLNEEIGSDAIKRIYERHEGRDQ